MRDIKAITDSSCDLSINLNTVDIVPRTFKFVGDDITYLDDYSRSDKDYCYRISLDSKVNFNLNKKDIYNTLVNNYEAGIRKFILLSQSSKINKSDYYVYIEAATEFKSKYKDVDTYVVDTGLYSIGLGLLASDIDLLIGDDRTYGDIIKYIETNKDLYETLIYVTKIDDFKMDWKEKLKVVGSRKGGYYPFVHFDKKKGFRVVSSSTLVISPIESLIERMKSEVDDCGSVMIGDFQNPDLSEKVEESVYMITGIDDIIITKLSKENGTTLGNKAVCLAYKKNR